MSISIVLWFDVEDYITPASDDSLCLILTMLNKRGIKATFKFVGEKIRVLKRCVREDIFKLLENHEIGYHTDMHSLHPTPAEFLEFSGFKEGAAAFSSKEHAGLMAVQAATGKKAVTYGQPGASWAPHVYPALKKWGIDTYIDGHDVISLNNGAFWFGGLLNITDTSAILRMELKEDELEPAKKRFEAMYDSFSDSSHGLISIFYHPYEFSTIEAWDALNFAKGVNKPESEWIAPKTRSVKEMEHYIEMLGSFLDYILLKPDIRFLSASEILENEKSGNTVLTRQDVKLLASGITNAISFIKYCGTYISASEMFSVFSEYLLENELKPQLIYGPDNHYESTLSGQKVKVSSIKSALKNGLATVLGYKQLPDFFYVDDARINAVDMMCTMAEIIKWQLNDDAFVKIPTGELIASQHVNCNDHWGSDWMIFKEGFRASDIIRNTKLQAWTLKPAVF